ncbi:MAG TPA: DUF4388 domain-containing protein [Polyangiaceae bacterium]|nr:DUF4388 domain-containing protein [Polyangiaceae bacterium]
MAASQDATALFDAAAAPAATTAGDLAPASTPGFAVRLPCAQLGDLIQINCLNRVRGAFRVSSSQGEGHLFFDAGQLVHASCRDQVGLDAVVVMLGWRSGSIEPHDFAGPVPSSIGMGADALLLHAAQRIDERARDAASHPAITSDATTKVVRRVPYPDEQPAADAPDAGAVTPPAEERRRSEHSGIALKSPFGPAGEVLARLEITRVAANGRIERQKAGASTELADTAFYCQRLATLVGEGLGLGPCRALACESADEGIVVFQGRSTVGARGKLADLEFVLAKVGLG